MTRHPFALFTILNKFLGRKLTWTRTLSNNGETTHIGMPLADLEGLVQTMERLVTGEAAAKDALTLLVWRLKVQGEELAKVQAYANTIDGKVVLDQERYQLLMNRAYPPVGPETVKQPLGSPSVIYNRPVVVIPVDTTPMVKQTISDLVQQITQLTTDLMLSQAARADLYDHTQVLGRSLTSMRQERDAARVAGEADGYSRGVEAVLAIITSGGWPYTVVALRAELARRRAS